MAFQQIIAPTTGAVLVTSATQFDTSTFQTIIIAADKLATTETVTIYALVNGTFVPASNLQGTAAGLTATVATIPLPGGPIYAVAKSATAAPCGIYWSGVLIY